MKRLGISLLVFIAVSISAEDIQAQQSVADSDFNSMYENLDSAVKTELLVEKSFKKIKFDEIEINHLPQILKDRISEDFGEAEAKKAYVKQNNGKNLYKIELEVNGEVKEYYADINGNFTDPEGLEYI